MSLINGPKGRNGMVPQNATHQMVHTNSIQIGNSSNSHMNHSTRDSHNMSMDYDMIGARMSNQERINLINNGGANNIESALTNLFDS